MNPTLSALLFAGAFAILIHLRPAFSPSYQRFHFHVLFLLLNLFVTHRYPRVGQISHSQVFNNKWNFSRIHKTFIVFFLKEYILILNLTKM